MTCQVLIVIDLDTPTGWDDDFHDDLAGAVKNEAAVWFAAFCPVTRIDVTIDRGEPAQAVERVRVPWQNYDGWPPKMIVGAVGKMTDRGRLARTRDYETARLARAEILDLVEERLTAIDCDVEGMVSA